MINFLHQRNRLTRAIDAKRSRKAVLNVENLEGRQVLSGIGPMPHPTPIAPPAHVVPATPKPVLDGDPPPISIPGGKIISQTSVTAGTRQVFVAQVQVAGATGNNMRIYATVVDARTHKPVRSNILISDYSGVGNHYVPNVAVLSTGKVVVAWGYVGLGGRNNRVLMRMVDPSAATTTTGVVQVNGSGSNSQEIGNANVRVGASGKFTVTFINWSVVKVYAADFSSNGIVTRPEYFFGYLTR